MVNPDFIRELFVSEQSFSDRKGANALLLLSCTIKIKLIVHLCKYISFQLQEELPSEQLIIILIMHLAADISMCVLALTAINSAAAAFLHSLPLFYRILALQIFLAFAYAAYLVSRIRMAPSPSLQYSRCYRFEGTRKVTVQSRSRVEDRELSWDEREIVQQIVTNQKYIFN